MKPRRTKEPSKRAHHLVAFARNEALRQKMAMMVLVQKSGVGHEALRRGLRGVRPMKMDDLEAVLNVLGYTAFPRKLESLQ